MLSHPTPTLLHLFNHVSGMPTVIDVYRLGMSGMPTVIDVYRLIELAYPL